MKKQQPDIVKQFDFKPDNCCINQFLSITHKNIELLDSGSEVISVFLYILKSLNKVWHLNIWRFIFEFQEIGITGELLNASHDFLEDRKQNIVLKGQIFSWNSLNSWVPSILVIQFFLIYVIDLPGPSDVKLFVSNNSRFPAVFAVALT